jgi:membrane protease YdiL (CAAX protease family)
VSAWLVLLVLLTAGPVGFLRLRDIDPDSTFSPVILVIAYAPALAAFGAAGITGGWSEVVALLGRFRNWRVAPWGYVAVLMGPIVLTLVAHATDLPSARTGSGWLDLGGVGAAAGPFLAGSVGEEPGWRGWAHPALRRRLSMPASGVVVGLVWALWHEWVLLAPGAVPSGADITVNSVRLVATAVIYGWLVDVTGSLPLVMVAHFGHNFAVALLPPITLTSQAVMTTGYVIVAVGLLLFRTGGRND